MRALTDAHASDSGVPGGRELVAFADAVVSGEAAEVLGAREQLREKLGDRAVVDAAAVIGNYERMVRIADGTGIPLDRSMALMTTELGEAIGIADFVTASHTPPVSALERILGRIMMRMMPLALRLMKVRYRGDG